MGWMMGSAGAGTVRWALKGRVCATLPRDKTPPVKEALATFKRFDIAYRLVTDAPCLLQSSMSSAVIVAYGLNSGSEPANCCCVARIGSS